jgi:thiosulfate reductase cytochrome b subunit
MAFKDKPAEGSQEDDDAVYRNHGGEPMQPCRIRTIVRWFHLGAAAIIGTSVYSPWSSDPVFASALKFAVFPLLALTGLVLWQQARLRRLADTSRSAPCGKRP